MTDSDKASFGKFPDDRGIYNRTLRRPKIYTLADTEKLCETVQGKMRKVRKGNDSELPVFLRNIASQHIAEKAGFVREGILKKMYLKDGEYLDGVIYALVK